MANSDKNIVIRPSIGSTIDQPSITFTGAGNTSITLKILDDSDGTLSFEGYQGQVFAINNNLASGIIYSVNDISGLPIIDANADGTIRLGIYTGNIGIGVTNPFQRFQIGAANTLGISTDGQIFVVTSNEDVGIGTTRPIVKLHVVGNTLVTGIVTATGGFNIGIQSAGVNITTGVVTALNFVGSGNTFNYNSSTRTIDISIAGGAGGSGNISISTNTTNQTQYLTYAVSTGSTSGLGVNLSSLVFNPSTTRLGIGTTNPLGTLQVGAGTSTFIINQVGTAVSVGIGTTNPQHNLHVIGDFAANTFLYSHISLGNISGITTINLNTASSFSARVTGITTFQFTNPTGLTASRAIDFVIELTNGGSHTITFPTSVNWENGVTPTLTGVGTDLIGFFTNNTGTDWTGSLLLKDVR